MKGGTEEIGYSITMQRACQIGRMEPINCHVMKPSKGGVIGTSTLIWKPTLEMSRQLFFPLLALPLLDLDKAILLDAQTASELGMGWAVVSRQSHASTTLSTA